MVLDKGTVSSLASNADASIEGVHGSGLQGLGMFGLFRPRGWDALPNNLVQEIRARLGAEFRDLDDLAERHGMFRQEYFKRSARDFDTVDLELTLFAFLVGSLGNQLGMREKFADAQRAFELSLKLKPTGNPSASSLANLHAMQNNTEAALEPAMLALDALWQDSEMRSSDEGRKTHVMLARIVTEAKLKEILGHHLLEVSREALEMSQGTWTDEQRNRTVYAALEFGGPEHELAVRETLAATEDWWFDVAIELLGRQLESSRDTDTIGVEDMLANWEFEAVNSRLVSLATACTLLNPDHIDAWVLLARLRDSEATAGRTASAEKAFHNACQALVRIDRFLAGDNDSLWTRDQSLANLDDDPTGSRSFMIGILQRTRNAATPQDLELASDYLA